MVVCVLLLIVITMTMRFLMDIMQREQESVAGKRAGERTIVALDQMGTDVRSTVSYERATGGGLGLDDLDFVETALLPDGAARSTFVNEKLDVVVASPWRLVLMVPSAGSTA